MPDVRQAGHGAAKDTLPGPFPRVAGGAPQPAAQRRWPAALEGFPPRFRRDAAWLRRPYRAGCLASRILAANSATSGEGL
jgi:hypothetical protein